MPPKTYDPALCPWCGDPRAPHVKYVGRLWATCGKPYCRTRHWQARRAGIGCRRHGCHNLVPPDRAEYCSPECREMHAKGVQPKAERIQVPLPSPHTADRTCLSCDRTFKSEGPWNRRCPKCSNPRLTPPVGLRTGRVHVPAGEPSRDLFRAGGLL